MRLAIFALAVGLGLAGCGGSGDPTTTEADMKAQLEAVIEQQLPKQVSQVSGPKAEAYVRRVSCVHKAGSNYECLAAVQIINGYHIFTERLPISGTCDNSECIWKVDY